MNSPTHRAKDLPPWCTTTGLIFYLLLIGVEAATGFAAEPSCVDHADKQRAGVVLGIAETFM